MTGRLLLLALLLPLIGACNMAISETPTFALEDSAGLAPRDGIWVSDDSDCRFDSSLPESQWPGCAIWVIVHSSGRELLLQDGKGEAQQARYVIAKGQPTIVQILWRDEAKEDGKSFYVFFGIEPGPRQNDGTFITASSWEVKCGVKDPSSSEIKPYPGIGQECRPESRNGIRSAAVASRPTAEMAVDWRWLRAEKR
jgi:hypothetical protein